MKQYASLHSHVHLGSNLRMKDATIKIENMLPMAEKLGITAIALTDHESVTAHIQFLKEVESFNKKHEHKIKPILGNEVYVVERNSKTLKEEYPDMTQEERRAVIYGHLVLLATNKNGHYILRKLSSQAWENGFYRGKYFTVPIDNKILKEHIVKGDVIASSACLGSLFARKVMNYIQAIKNGSQGQPELSEIDTYLRDIVDIFGRDNFYIEIQPNDKSTDQWNYNIIATKLAKKYGLPLLVTTDAHYLRPENAKAHEIFLKSQDNGDREVQEFYKYTYLMSREEIEKMLVPNIGEDNTSEALDNTLKVAERVVEYSLHEEEQMPVTNTQDKPSGLFSKFYSKLGGMKYFAESKDKYNQQLLYEIEKGFSKKILSKPYSKEKIAQYIREINANLEVLQDYEINFNRHYSQYFLTAQDFLNDLKQNVGTLVGVSRGSASGFIINYLLDIVDIDAVEYNLPYWRFLAKGRLDSPDYSIVA